MCSRMRQLSLSATDLDFAGNLGDVRRKQLSTGFIPLHISMHTVILRACGRVSDRICQPDPVAHRFLRKIFPLTPRGTMIVFCLLSEYSYFTTSFKTVTGISGNSWDSQSTITIFLRILWILPLNIS